MEKLAKAGAQFRGSRGLHGDNWGEASSGSGTVGFVIYGRLESGAPGWPKLGAVAPMRSLGVGLYD
jgi:hypothetical protein